jgi:hypothetical protein
VQPISKLLNKKALRSSSASKAINNYNAMFKRKELVELKVRCVSDTEDGDADITSSKGSDASDLIHD